MSRLSVSGMAARVKRTLGQGGGRLRLVSALAGQQVPAGVEVVRLGTPKGIVLQRVLLADPSEAAIVDPVRSQARCAPLSPSPD